MKVIAKGISQFPGCVEDVSKSGCKINFPDVGDVDLESEYAATMYSQPCGSPNSEGECLDLLLKPRWIARNGAGAMIGFSVLCAPGYRGFMRLVGRIAEMNEDSEAALD